MCLCSTPSAESQPQHGDCIMFARCSPSHTLVKKGRKHGGGDPSVLDANYPPN